MLLGTGLVSVGRVPLRDTPFVDLYCPDTLCPDTLTADLICHLVLRRGGLAHVDREPRDLFLLCADTLHQNKALHQKYLRQIDKYQHLQQSTAERTCYYRIEKHCRSLAFFRSLALSSREIALAEIEQKDNVRTPLLLEMQTGYRGRSIIRLRVRVLEDTQFSVIAAAYRAKLNFAPGVVFDFVFFGEVLDMSSTPAELLMETGNLISVLLREWPGATD